MENQYILAIETSCDETAAAIIKNGSEIVSNVVSSQIESHKRFGGVVPEIASRHHVEQITLVIEEALAKAEIENTFSEDHKWVKHISKEEKAALIEAGYEVEPDFYLLTREKFRNPVIMLLYLVFFVIVWFHMRHAFASAFQTLGLNNYKYSKAIEICAIIYAWFVCLAFTAVDILVFLGF